MDDCLLKQSNVTPSFQRQHINYPVEQKEEQEEETISNKEESLGIKLTNWLHGSKTIIKDIPVINEPGNIPMIRCI